MLTPVEIIWAAQVAACAWVLILLMEPGQILGWYGRWLTSKTFSWPEWLRHPLGECPRCFAGQCGFWSACVIIGPYPGKLIVFTLITIFFNEIIRAWQNK